MKARIEALDTDGDGQLSAAELAAPPMQKRLFDRLDANHDGVVTEEEIAAARERMQDRMQGDRPGPRMDRREDRGGHGDRPGDRRQQPPKPPMEGEAPAAQ